jgi:hypothetical protein
MHRTLSAVALALAGVLVIALFLHPTAALAAAIAPGDRVQINYDPKQALTGTVVSLDSKSMVIHPDGASDNTTVETSAVRSLQRFEGQKSCWVNGMLIGGMVGLVGGVVGAAMSEDGAFDTAILLTMPVGGAALGTLIGAFIKKDKWEDVRLSGLEVGMISGDGRGVAVSWNLRF